MLDARRFQQRNHRERVGRSERCHRIAHDFLERCAIEPRLHACGSATTSTTTTTAAPAPCTGCTTGWWLTRRDGGCSRPRWCGCAVASGATATPTRGAAAAPTGPASTVGSVVGCRITGKSPDESTESRAVVQFTPADLIPVRICDLEHQPRIGRVRLAHV